MWEGKEIFMHSRIDYTLYEKIIAFIKQKGEVSKNDIEKEICEVRSWVGLAHLCTLCECGKVICREGSDGSHRGRRMYSIANDTDNPFDNSYLCDKILSFLKKKEHISEEYLKNSIAEFRQDEDISGLRRYLAPLITSNKIVREGGWLHYMGK
jgi:hypothetical protein